MEKFNKRKYVSEGVIRHNKYGTVIEHENLNFSVILNVDKSQPVTINSSISGSPTVSWRLSREMSNTEVTRLRDELALACSIWLHNMEDILEKSCIRIEL